MSGLHPDLRLLRVEEEDVGDDPSVIAPFRLVMPASTLLAPARTHDTLDRYRFDGEDQGDEHRLYQPHPLPR